MQDDNGKAINSLTIDQPVSGELIVQPAVESQLDIMWMLGAKGKAKVVNCEMSFVPDKSWFNQKCVNAVIEPTTDNNKDYKVSCIPQARAVDLRQRDVFVGDK